MKKKKRSIDDEKFLNSPMVSISRPDVNKAPIPEKTHGGGTLLISYDKPGELYHRDEDSVKGMP